MSQDASQGTPLKLYASALKQYAQIEPTAAQAQVDYCDDMQGHWLGPRQPREFLDDYMPCAPERTPKVTFRVPKESTSERQMYGQLVRLRDSTSSSSTVTQRVD